MSTPSSALSAPVVAAIEDLELAARTVVEGIRAGGHPSPLKGFGAEFRQHRPYRAGDDLKYLDWKLLARTDRLYTRQFRDTTSMSVMLVPDSSASMAFPEEGLSKHRYQTILAAALAWLATAAGDGAGLMTAAGGDRLDYLPARGGRAHLRRVLAHLDSLRPRGAWDPVRAIDRASELLVRRGLLLVLSDFYDREEETLGALRRARRRGHDVAMLQVISGPERRFPYGRQVELRDLETGGRRVVDAAAAAAYREAVEAFLARCRAGALRGGIDYALVSTDDPPARALRQFLLARADR